MVGEFISMVDLRLSRLPLVSTVDPACRKDLQRTKDPVVKEPPKAGRWLLFFFFPTPLWVATLQLATYTCATYSYSKPVVP